jgi:hypothetical protein
MRSRDAGRVDWAVIAAVAAVITAAAAVVVAVGVLRLTREEVRQERARGGLDSLWHFTTEWQNPDMLDTRSAAANALLSGRASHDVDAVLDFFDEVAMLIDRGVLDPELVWYELYWPMANYWSASQDYVRKTRADEPTAWEQLSGIVPRLTAIEARRRHRSVDDVAPTKTQTRDFLNAEVGSGACGEDEETQRTPL